MARFLILVSAKGGVHIDSTREVSGITIVLERSPDKTIAQVLHAAQSVENINTTVENSASLMFRR